MTQFPYTNHNQNNFNNITYSNNQQNQNQNQNQNINNNHNNSSENCQSQCSAYFGSHFQQTQQDMDILENNIEQMKVNEIDLNNNFNSQISFNGNINFGSKEFVNGTNKDGLDLNNDFINFNNNNNPNPNFRFNNQNAFTENNLTPENLRMIPNINHNFNNDFNSFNNEKSNIQFNTIFGCQSTINNNPNSNNNLNLDISFSNWTGKDFNKCSKTIYSNNQN